MRALSSTPYSLWFGCPHAFWINTRLNLVAKSSVWHTQMGNILHDATEGLCSGVQLSATLGALKEACNVFEGETIDGYPKSLEAYWVASGTVLSFERYRLPSFLHQYRTVKVEQEITYPISDKLYWMCRPDLVLRRQEDAAILNCNIKSTKWMSDLLHNHTFSVQMLLEAEGVRRKWRSQPAGTVVLGLNKGSLNGPNKADLALNREGTRLESPMSYAWYDNSRRLSRWQRGAMKQPLWLEFASPEEAFNALGEEVTASLADYSEPQHHYEYMDIKSVISDIIHIDQWTERGIHPKSYHNCTSFESYKKPCDYYKYCWGTDAKRKDNFVKKQHNHPFEETVKHIN